jgi:hypothetical protein
MGAQKGNDKQKIPNDEIIEVVVSLPKDAEVPFKKGSQVY